MKSTAFLVFLCLLCLLVGPSQALDANRDGLSDVWQRLYKAEGVDPNADPDGDGMTNRQESIAGTDPFDAMDTFEARVEAADFGIYLKWKAVVGKAYRVESSSDLGGEEPWKLDENLSAEGFDATYDYDRFTGIVRLATPDTTEDPNREVTLSEPSAAALMKFFRVHVFQVTVPATDTDAWETWILARHYGDEDPDGDGLNNAEEHKQGTSPHNPDTDGGGLFDGFEVALGKNPSALDGSESPDRRGTSRLVVYTPTPVGLWE